MLERGDFLPRERENWDPAAVFVDRAIQHTEKRCGKAINSTGCPFGSRNNPLRGAAELIHDPDGHALFLVPANSPALPT
jgi:hypothetical protein